MSDPVQIPPYRDEGDARPVKEPGAQGGGAADVAGAFDDKGMGAIVNSSRGILCAWKKEGCAPEEFAAAARREALRMKADIVGAIR